MWKLKQRKTEKLKIELKPFFEVAYCTSTERRIKSQINYQRRILTFRFDPVKHLKGTSTWSTLK